MLIIWKIQKLNFDGLFWFSSFLMKNVKIYVCPHIFSAYFLANSWCEAVHNHLSVASSNFTPERQEATLNTLTAPESQGP